MTWVKLEKGDDWGSVYYALPGERLKGGGACVSNGVKLRFGDQYSVRFPDGYVGSCYMGTMAQSGSVSDHGHSYAVASKRFGVFVNFHGIALWVEVNEVELCREEL